MTDFYELAKKYFVDTQNKQIQKGLSTYGKALDPEEWTTQQLYQHAMDEIVDNVHYLTALLVRSEAAVSRAAELEEFVRDIATNYDHDEDAHKYNTPCRVCEAEKLLDKSILSPPKPLMVTKGIISKEEALKMLDEIVPVFIPEEKPKCKHSEKVFISRSGNKWYCKYCGKDSEAVKRDGF